MSTTIQTPPASAEEAIQVIRASTTALPTETVSLHDALHRVLRERIVAPEDQPQFDRSSVDGFAIRMDETGEHCEIVDHIRAGEWKSQALESGQAVRIATGAALPCEGTTVVMKEDVLVEGNRVRILSRNGDRNIRFRGEDMRAGQVLMSPGARLSHGPLALLASIGKVSVLVTRRPRVLHLATGDEVVEPGRTPGPGQIRDSNSTLVRACLNEWGAELVQARAGEDASNIEAALRSHGGDSAAFDLLLISGGASVGEHDCSRSVLERFGYDIRIQRTNTRPGKPLVFGAKQGSVAFALPGNPLAHFVCLNLYVRSALETLAALSPASAFVPGYLAEPLSETGHARHTLWPATWTLTAEGAQVKLLPWQSSGDLTCLASANALASIPASSGALPAGAYITFYPLL